MSSKLWSGKNDIHFKQVRKCARNREILQRSLCYCLHMSRVMRICSTKIPSCLDLSPKFSSQKVRTEHKICVLSSSITLLEKFLAPINIW
jgi:hypothetical protein